jgi:hypothetical protein
MEKMEINDKLKTKNGIKIIMLMLFISITFFSSKFSFSQYLVSSTGPAPLTQVDFPPSANIDNLLNSSSRGYVYFSRMSRHLLYKQLMGSTTNLTSIGELFTDAGWIGAIARKPDGTLYINKQSKETLYSTLKIWKVDTATGNTTIVCSDIDEWSDFTGMVWDHTTNKMYGCITSMTESKLITINLTTGAFTDVGPYSTICPGAISLSCAPNGTLFSVDIVNDCLYKWNKITGVPILVGSLGVNAIFGQDAAFDLSDGTLYWAASLTDLSQTLRIIDTVTGSGTVALGSYPVQASCIAIISKPVTITHTPLLSTPNLTGPYVVNAKVVTSYAGIASSKIYWSRDNNSVTDSVSMTNSGGNNWTGSIPGNGSIATYRYYIKATNGIGVSTTYPDNAPASLNLFYATTTDTTKPVITHTAIGNTPKTLWPATVNCTATDPFGMDSVWVVWWKNSGTKTRFNLTHGSGNNWSGTFNSVQPEVIPGDVIHYKIIARDASSQHNIDSTGQNNFSINIQTSVCIGTGSITMGMNSGPFNTHYNGNRTNMLYLASEISANSGSAGYINKIGFNIYSASEQMMSEFNIRMQHTTSTSLSGFTSYGWTTVYSGTYSVPGMGWQYIELTTPFAWDGTSNLLVEICFSNTIGGNGASTVLGTTMSNMEYTQFNGSSPACDYIDYNSPIAQTARANVCFVINSPITGMNLNNNIMPTKYLLSQNYPNPFNPVTRINFAIPKQGLVNLKIFDILGREIISLVNEIKTPGTYSVDFNAVDLSSGVYFYKLESNDYMEIKRMVLLK